MELTLTGGTTLREKLQSAESGSSTETNTNVARSRLAATTRQTSSLSQSHQHSHDHSHGHNHNHCAKTVFKLDASTLLPSQEQVDQFKTNTKFRLNILSNVVRGGPYELFIDLLTVLVSDGNSEKRNTTDGSMLPSAINNSAIEGADPVELAQMLDGFGADGHTLTHWCAKRGL